MKFSRPITLVRLATLILAASLISARPAAAQFSSLKGDLLFHINPPPGRAFVQKGKAEYIIGVGNVRALFRYREVAIKVMQGEREALSVAVDRLPTRFVWDTTFVPDGKYQIRVVVTEKNGRQTIADYVRADVANGPPVVAKAPVSAEPLPKPKWDKIGVPTKITKGETTLPTLGWPSSAPDSMTPMVYIFKDNVLIDRMAAGANPEGGERRFVFNNADWQDGTYRFVLMAVDLNSDREEICDQFTATLGDTRPKPRGGLAPLPGRDSWIPHDLPADLTDYPMYEPDASRSEIEAVKKKRFEWVLAVSRRVGDPHPEIAAAQFAQESGWGEHVSGSNNLFGIKARPGEDATAKATQEWDGGAQAYATVDYFKNYQSVYHCILDRCQSFLKKSRYAKYWTARGSEAAISALHQAGYCTDPDYVSQIMGILNRQQRKVANR